MNSARRAAAGQARRARKENAGTEPASGFWKTCGLLTAWRRPVFAAGATPQDPVVSFAFRPVSSTIERLLWLSEFNAVVDVRCLDQRIEQLNMRLLFTLKQFRSQEFSRISRARCSISSTSLRSRVHHRLMRTHEVARRSLAAAPNSALRRSDPRSRASRSGCAPFSDRSSRSARAADFGRSRHKLLSRRRRSPERRPAEIPARAVPRPRSLGRPVTQYIVSSNQSYANPSGSRSRGCGRRTRRPAHAHRRVPDAGRFGQARIVCRGRRGSQPGVRAGSQSAGSCAARA